MLDEYPRASLAPSWEAEDGTRHVMCAGCGQSLAMDQHGCWENGEGHDSGCPVNNGEPSSPWVLHVCPNLLDGTHFLDTTQWYPAWWTAPVCEECADDMEPLTGAVAYQMARSAYVRWIEEGQSVRGRRAVTAWQGIAAELAQAERDKGAAC